MKKTMKKILALFLVAVMTITAIPLSGFEAKAYDIPGYSAGAAVMWAEAHLNDVYSPLLDYGIWENGGDCANFVSQCLYMGGLDMNLTWHSNGCMRYNGNVSDGVFIRAQQLHDYLVSLGGQSIVNPSASQVSVGDVIFYRKSSSVRMSHTAIVVGFESNGTPIIAYHSTGSKTTGVYTIERTNNWHLSFGAANTILVKMYGDTCVAQKAKSFDVYIANSGNSLYSSPGRGYQRSVLAGDWVHVSSTQYYNGSLWGYTCCRGVYGWINLSYYRYYTHAATPIPSHDFGDWYTVKKSTCLENGYDQHVCKKCGYTETRTTYGGHVTVDHATCLQPGFCSLCGTQTEDPLGHNFGDWEITIEPTCTEMGEKKHICKRCEFVEYADVDALGHDDVHVTTAPTCTDLGTALYECQRCGRQTVNYIDTENTISDWTEEVVEGLEPVESKVQYRYSDKSTTTSYSTSLDGWTQYSSEWVQSGYGESNYVNSWPYGWYADDWHYLNFRVGPYTAYETETTKRDVSNSHVGYLNAHWCRGNDNSSTSKNTLISQTYTSEFWKFHAFGSYDNKATSITENAYKYDDGYYCNTTYWWHVNLQTPYYWSTYTDYNKLFHYYQWSDWSEWQDEAVTASDTRQVETRTVYKYDLAALGHDFSVEDENSYVAPTCTEPGHTGVKCSRCGALSPDGKKLDPLGHILYDEPEYTQSREELIGNGEEAPYGYWYFDSVNSDGYNVYRRDCGRECGYHEFKIEGNDTCIYELTDETERTCTQDHKYIYTCKDHGETMEVIIEEAYGHEADGNWIVTSAASCANGGKDGEKVCNCVRNDGGITCDKVFTEVIPAPDHQPVTVEGKAPTCMKDGYTESMDCSVCKETLTAAETIEALGHDDSGEWTKPDHEPTCGETVWIYLYCCRETENGTCGALLDEKAISGPEHEYEVVETVPSTCCEEGYEKNRCKNCGDELIISLSLDPEAHGEGEWKTVQEKEICEIPEIKISVCPYCEEELDKLETPPDYEHHNWVDEAVASSCTTGGYIKTYCTQCGEIKGYVDDDADGHDMSEWKIVTAATCTEQGIMRTDCQREGCGYYEEKYIDAIGHSYQLTESCSATCTEPGNEVYVCANDASHTYIVITENPLGHDMGEWYTVIEATCTEKGLEKRECQRHNCDYSEERETAIDPDNHYEETFYTVDEKADCENNGKKSHHCERCDKSLDEVVIPAREHDIESLTTDSTCSNEGKIVSTCSHTDSTDEYNACSYTTTEVIGIEPDSHDWGEWYVETAPTCSAVGVEKRICKLDSDHVETRDIAIDPDAHKAETFYTVDKKADCENNGSKSHHCEYCDEILDTEVIIKKEHNHDKGVVTTTPTCTEDGIKTYTCTNIETEEYKACTHSYTETIPATGHDWGEWTTETPATCEEDGLEKRVCKNDASHVEENVLTAIGHAWDEGVIDPSSTCKDHGTKTYTCQNDASHTYTKEVELDENNHVGEKYTEDAKDATCTEDGYTGDTYCSDCDKLLEQGETIPALTHDMGEWYTVIEATCTEKGLEKRECQRHNCDYSEERETAIDPDNHYAETFYTVDEKADCANDGKKSHHCERCDVSLDEVVISKREHAYDNGTETTAPTCTQDGIKTYTCTNAETEEYKACTHSYTEPIAALGHNMGSWSNNNNATHTKECQRENCDYTETENCTFSEWVTIKEATCTEKGEKERECTVCGYVETAEIELKAHTPGKATEENRVEAKCEEAGSYDEVVYCTECNEELSREEKTIDPIGHAWDEGVIDPSSTCKDHGTKTYTCQNDASHTYTKEVELDENNHVGEKYIKDAKEPDCTNDGYTGDTYCSDCDKLLEQGETIPALTHDMGEWYTVEKATCTEKGLEKRECQRDNCDYSEEREIAIDPDNHYAETFYTVDEKADCEDDGKKSHHCEHCDISLDEVVISKRDHAYDNGTETTAPTCTQDGVKTYTCTNTETEEYNACTHSYTETIPATGHDWGEWTTETPATCEEDGLEKRVCKNDSSHVEENTLSATGHDYIGVTTAPNCTEQGYTTYTCSECDDTYVADYVDEHGHDYHLIAEKSKAPDYGIAGFDYYECSYDASHYYTESIDPLVKATYTATFVVTAPFFDEDKTVGTVIFEQGDKYVDEPSVESYKNYTFAWDEYELKDEDIVIYGRYTEIEIDGVSDLETNKTATYNNGIASITLEAKSATKNIKVLSENTKPVDVILVLDQSGSMAETLSSNGTTKKDALIDCANRFVNELYENAVATGADHRVALVGFAYSGYSTGNYKNTGILATTQGKPFNYAELKKTDSAYKTALIPVVGDNGINKYITNGINNVAADGATAADLGLEIANDIYAVTENDGTRERIVIFITDGTPTSWGETTDLVESTSAAAITQANRLKNQQGAKIYSVGVHANADPTAKFTDVDSGVTTDKKGTFNSFDFNRFLHAVSSNYPESGSMKISDLGDGSKDSGYYMGVNDTSNLSNIFSKILYSAVYEINTFDKVTLVDTISKEFTLTLEQEAAMRENLTATLGIRNEDISVIRNADGTTTVKFANVRATKVYNNDGSSYYSASVSFEVSADADSLEGGNVATNTDDAYVDMSGENIGSFTVPTVNIEQNRNIVVFTINGVVYRIDEVNLGDNVVAPESELAKWNIAQDTLVTENCAYFEASEVSDAKYTVTWISEGKQETQTYTFGSTITAPEAGEKAEYDFIKWSPDVPATMPAYNMTFTAVYTTKHTHSFNKSHVYGDCESGRTTVYVCSCGETKKETTEPTTHTCEAVVTKTNNGTLVDRVSCTVCGKYVEQNLTYKVSYSQGFRTTVLDLSLYENEVLVQPDGTLKIMFYLGSDANKNYTVYRIDENGKTTKYTPEKKNGYLIFEVDHFSIYVISEIDSETEKPLEDINYNEALCVLNGHNYASEVTESTCLLNGYTTYTCTGCGDTYTADETVATGHTDANSDGKCDVCTASTTDDCNCACHKTGFIGFFWKILRFLYKLFRINPICKCGAAHY